MMHKSGIMGFSYLFGLVFASFFTLIYGFSIGIIIVIIGIVGFLIKRFSFGLSAISFGIAMVVFSSFVWARYNPVVRLADSTMEISGEVIEKSDTTQDVMSYVIRGNLDGTYAKLSLFTQDIDAQLGDAISFEGKLSPLRDNTVFSESSYNLTKGIFLKASPKGKVSVQPSEKRKPSFYIGKFRGYISDNISKTLDGEEGDFLKATFLGDSSSLNYYTKNSMERTGLAHYLAVSGMHLSLSGNILMLFLNKTKLKSKGLLKLLILVVVLVVFMMFYQLSTSVLRSGIMLLIYYGSDFFRRKSSGINSIGFALLVILLGNPFAYMDIGLLLSIAGTYGVAVTGPAINKAINKRVTLGRFSTIREIVVTTACANLLTTPIVLLAFKGISISSIVVNVIVSPLFNLALIAIIAYALLGGIGGFLLLIAGVTAKIMLAVIKFFADIPYSYIYLDYEFIPLWLLASVVLIISTYYIFKSYGFTGVSVGVSSIALIALVIGNNYINRDNKLVTILSDGKAGAVIITGQGVDSIYLLGDNPKVERLIDIHLRNHGINAISLISAPDLTVRGVASYREMLENREIKQIALNLNELGLVDELDIPIIDISNMVGNVKLSNDETVSFGEFGSYYSFADFTLITTSVKDEEIKHGDIAVYKDYRKKEPVLFGDINIFVNRRQNTDFENSYSGFFDSISYYITPKGEIMERGTYGLYK